MAGKKMEWVGIVAAVLLAGAAACGDANDGAATNNGAGPNNGAADVGADADETYDASDDASTGGDAADVPEDDAQTTGALPIDEALTRETCGQGFGAPRMPPNSLKAGTDLHKITLDAYPDARCNDGTPAVMYVKRAADPARIGEWIFHLQGGGSCNADFDSCKERWCGYDFYDASKMSSRFTPETIGGKGISSQHDDNAFRDANHVYAYYCSSDSWTGQADDVTLTSEDGQEAYTLHFRGHSIAEAIIDDLMDGATSDDGEQVMPALAEAESVLISGTSGGSAGAVHNVDWIAARLSPPTRVVAVFDANFPPLPEDFADAEVADAVIAFSQERWARAFVERQNAFVDESCLQTLGGTDDAWRCSRTSYVMLNHITTPWFARMDLGDSVISGNYIGLGGTLEAFGAATHATLSRAPTLSTDAAEADAIDFTPGVYAPACRQHVGLTNDLWFLRTTVEDDQGTLWTFHDALAAWLDGQDVFAVDTIPPSRSVCGAVDDARGK